MLLRLSIASLILMTALPGWVRANRVRQKSSPLKGSRFRAAKPAPPTPSYAVDAVNNPQTAEPLKADAVGPAALRAQILLGRVHFSPGEIDGRIGSNTLRAVAGLRSARNMPAGDTIDDNVWNVLNANSAPALIAYTITADDLKGPFTRAIPSEMMAKAKLQYLGYASPREKIAERFHINPALLQKLNRGKSFDVAGSEVIVPNALATAPAKAARVVVSKSESTVKVLDDRGMVIAQYPCTSGSEYDPLPIGEWKIKSVQKNPIFYYNPRLFWDAKSGDTKATIAPGPRSPVGLVWIDLSKEHYGIHGTPTPSEIGYAQSHGCIRLTNWDALQLAEMVKPGTPASLVQ